MTTEEFQTRIADLEAIISVIFSCEIEATRMGNHELKRLLYVARCEAATSLHAVKIQYRTKLGL